MGVASAVTSEVGSIERGVGGRGMALGSELIGGAGIEKEGVEVVISFGGRAGGLGSGVDKVDAVGTESVIEPFKVDWYFREEFDSMASVV